MSNLAYLVGDDTPTPLGPDSEYDHAARVLCVSKSLIPIFWLFCFEESDILAFEWDGYRFPTLVRRHGAVEELVADRTDAATQLLPAHIERWEEWLQLIEECPFPFLKLDAFEIWSMGSEDPVDELVRALRSFTTGQTSDLQSLFWLASIKYDVPNARVKYDVAKRDFTWKPHESPGLYLQGGRRQREVPWEED